MFSDYSEIAQYLGKVQDTFGAMLENASDCDIKDIWTKVNAFSEIAAELYSENRQEEPYDLFMNNWEKIRKIAIEQKIIAVPDHMKVAC